jgi:hypothetical protein
MPACGFVPLLDHLVPILSQANRLLQSELKFQTAENPFSYFQLHHLLDIWTEKLITPLVPVVDGKEKCDSVTLAQSQRQLHRINSAHKATLRIIVRAQLLADRLCVGEFMAMCMCWAFLRTSVTAMEEKFSTNFLSNHRQVQLVGRYDEHLEDAAVGSQIF